MRIWYLILGGLLAACTVQAPAPVQPVPQPAPGAGWSSPAQAYAAFGQVAARVEPVAERTCLAQTRGMNCDFRIVIDRSRGQAPNAYQSLSKDGRPIITFTASLIEDTHNADELAFVMGHEAAHHIQGHLARQEQNAAAGAVVFAGLATLTGGSAADVQVAQELGAVVGARSYSKEFELEADVLGTVIAYTAGYDPVRGAAYFSRLPDPGNRFLGTHPPNADRQQAVRQTMAQF